MNLKILRQILMLSKYMVYGICVQTWLCTVLLANDGLAQQKSLEDVYITVQLHQVKLEKALEIISSKTDFSFAYNGKTVEKEMRVTASVNNQSLAVLLRDLSKNAGLQFKRVNSHIYVSNRRSFARPVIEIVEEKQQEVNISGRVTDGDSGEGLPGVSILVKGTNKGTTTDFEGKYSISAPENATLVFSFIGYEAQEVVISNRSQIDIVLQADVSELEEVVVVGYGTQKKVNLTGSVATISAEEIAKRPVTNAFQALQGTMPGLQVIQNSGKPGAEGFNLNIRGINSFSSETNNAPLILIDGVEGNLQDLDPDNIESVSVLKDASSAAIYGSRAANGVILVTTKKGSGGKLTVTYHGNIGIHKATRLPELITNSVEYMEMYNRAAESSGKGNLVPEALLDEWRNADDPVLYPNTDWVNEVVKSTTVKRHHLGVSGATGKTNYNISIGTWNQDGIVIGSWFEKYTLFLNLESRISDKFKVGGGATGLYSKRRESYNGDSDIMLAAFASPPTYAPYVPDGSGHYAQGAYNNNPGDYPEFGQPAQKNPVAAAYEGIGQRNNQYNVNMNAFTELKLLKGLTWLTKGALKYDHGYFKSMRPVVPTYNYRDGRRLSTLDGIGTTTLNVDNNFSTHFTVYSTLNYEKTFAGKHNLNAMAGFSQEEYQWQNNTSNRKDLPSLDISEINAGSAEGQSTTGTSTEWATRSWFGRIAYNYDERYLLEVNLRYDGSSRFKKGEKWGAFPSVSAAWRISEENFLKGSAGLTNLKLRGSYGVLGNQNIGNYPYQNLINPNYSYPFGSSILPGGTLTRLVDPLITWESTRIFDIGLDAEIKSGLLSLTVDYFDKRTENILRTAQLPGSAGLDAPTINSGINRNKGWEFILGHRNTVGEFSYGATINLAIYKTEVEKLGAEEIGTYTINQEGQPVGSYYMWEWDGIFQSQEEIDNAPTQPFGAQPGDLRLKDQNDDGVVDGDDRVLFDGAHPDFSYGFNLFANYKGFDFSAFFQGVQGRKLYMLRWGIEPFSQGASSPTVKWRNAWTAENPSTTVPRIFYGETDPKSATSMINSYWLQNASYLRLKNLSVGYTFPKSLTEKFFVERLRVYFAGENLFTLVDDGFEGIDPERATNTGDLAMYPQLAVYSFGVNVQF
ncbi:TonB-dependent receptor [Rapidithrix thailandica]|uniref:TonB-dependent receptor n=1 Tax=Rapidithrix thailandica TaxID=413964 RepID=A0AAW9S5Z9_9BACT